MIQIDKNYQTRNNKTMIFVINIFCLKTKLEKYAELVNRKRVNLKFSFCKESEFELMKFIM